jgi:hypothetical protein
MGLQHFSKAGLEIAIEVWLQVVSSENLSEFEMSCMMGSEA